MCDVLIKSPTDDQGTDYILTDGANSCWVTVGNISVYIQRTDEGVAVDLYPQGRAADSALAYCWATFAEAKDEEDV
jgi:hypothetical protein